LISAARRERTLAETTQQPILDIQHLCWNVNGKDIISDISFSIEQGNFVGLLGPNGSGKSTLLRCLYRYIQPSSGTIALEQQCISEISRQDYAKQVAVVLQHSPDQFELSVKHVVSLGLVPYKGYGVVASENDIVRDALNKVGMASKSDQLFDSLSGGEKQRVMIAKAIVQRPKLLIMDEPTSHLDVKYQIQIMELAKSLGITVLASFHDLNLAASMCDQLIVLKEGKLAHIGSPQDVITEELIGNVFGVCCHVSHHPQTQSPHVTFYYGYNQGDGHGD
jgi:iron complex transport system ATP-binding protein